MRLETECVECMYLRDGKNYRAVGLVLCQRGRSGVDATLYPSCPDCMEHEFANGSAFIWTKLYPKEKRRCV